MDWIRLDLWMVDGNVSVRRYDGRLESLEKYFSKKN